MKNRLYSEIQFSYQQHRPLRPQQIIPAPATSTVSFVSDETDSRRIIPTFTFKNTPKRLQKRKFCHHTDTS